MIKLKASSRHAVLLFVSILMLAPLAFMLITALKTQGQYDSSTLALPDPLTFKNITSALSDPQFTTWFVNSVVITLGSVALSTFVSVPAAYAIARSSGRWPRALVSMMIFLLAIPSVVLVVPLFIMMVHLGLLNSRTGIIIVYAALFTPLAIYLLVGFFRGIPESLDDAAFIDGAGRFHVLVYVLLPMMRPALVTLAVVGVVYVWNEFLIALLFLQSQGEQTLMVGIASLQGRNGVDETVLAAWSLIASLPIVLAYIFAQRHFVRGLVAGALK